MRRTTIYLEPDLEVLLKLEMVRQNRPMAEIVREAVSQYLSREPAAPPGAGAFGSGRADTAEDVDEALTTSGFGATAGGAPRSRKSRATPPPRRNKRRVR
jgi:hypothetical protein